MPELPGAATRTAVRPACSAVGDVHPVFLPPPALAHPLPLHTPKREGDVTAPDLAPDPGREPVRLGDLFPEVVEVLAETTATQRINQRHNHQEDER